MVSSHLRLIIVAGLLALGACTVTPLAPQKDYAPVAIPDSSPAHSLLASARNARSRGDTGAAGRYLERALSMAGAGEATVLYRELADLRLAEDKPRDAEGLALRALREAPDNPEWRAGLWELLATARQRQGNAEGSAAARAEADRLRGEAVSSR